MADGGDATMVVEAVTESAVAKTRAFAQACAVFAAGTPLASCSSAIPIEELADWSGRPRTWSAPTSRTRPATAWR
ncbi:3-hydroxyacyl-CoA dehydrogenase NAD-binding domain-containing protein [Catenulispora yoronensis]